MNTSVAISHNVIQLDTFLNKQATTTTPTIPEINTGDYVAIAGEGDSVQMGQVTDKVLRGCVNQPDQYWVDLGNTTRPFSRENLTKLTIATA